MKILALDLGRFNTMCCYFDTKTRKHEFINVGVVIGNIEHGVRADCDRQANDREANIEMSRMRW